MYSGTCELYDGNNPTADGNSGWACYDKAIKTTYTYQHVQGICPAGVKVAEWRDKTKAWCEAKCNADQRCHSYLFAEGTRHMYTNTCALFDANNPTADGNTGWSCYNRVEQTSLDWLKQKSFEAMSSVDENDTLYLY